MNPKYSIRCLGSDYSLIFNEIEKHAKGNYDLLSYAYEFDFSIKNSVHLEVTSNKGKGNIQVFNVFHKDDSYRMLDTKKRRGYSHLRKDKDDLKLINVEHLFDLYFNSISEMLSTIKKCFKELDKIGLNFDKNEYDCRKPLILLDGELKFKYFEYIDCLAYHISKVYKEKFKPSILVNSEKLDVPAMTSGDVYLINARNEIYYDVSKNGKPYLKNQLLTNLIRFVIFDTVSLDVPEEVRPHLNWDEKLHGIEIEDSPIARW